jgi:hypothetical protein
VRLASPIGSAAGGSVNLSTSLSNVAKPAAHPKFVWVFNANCDGTIIYNVNQKNTRVRFVPIRLRTRVLSEDRTAVRQGLEAKGRAEVSC